MCELFALSASQPVDIKLSLAELARHGGETGIHGDGWGVAYLDGRDVRLFREPSAAAFSPWVRCVQEHPIQSDTVIAHVRHATKGAISLANTQPFARELSGCMHVFAHNGDLGEAFAPAATEKWRFRPIGETDSEMAFCLLMERLAKDIANAMFDAFARISRDMRDHGPANIIYASNGRLLVHADRRTRRPGVIEPPGLWMLERQCSIPSEPAVEGGGVSVGGGATHVVLFASVPLTSELWQPLERGTVLEVMQGAIATRRVV